MRISDWSSDVCSSDLSLDLRGSRSPRGLAFLRQRGGQRLRAQGYGPGLAAALPDLGYCDRSLRNAHRLPARYRDDRGKSRPHRSAQTRRSEEHTSELQSLMRISYAVFCLKKKKMKKRSIAKHLVYT